MHLIGKSILAEFNRIRLDFQISPTELLSCSQGGSFLLLNRADWTRIGSFSGFLNFQVAVGLARYVRNAAGPREFPLENRGRQLPTKIAIYTLFSDKIFSDSF